MRRIVPAWLVWLVCVACSDHGRVPMDAGRDSAIEIPEGVECHIESTAPLFEGPGCGCPAGTGYCAAGCSSGCSGQGCRFYGCGEGIPLNTCDGPEDCAAGMSCCDQGSWHHCMTAAECRSLPVLCHDGQDTCGAGQLCCHGQCRADCPPMPVPPTADAGADQTVLEGTVVQLSGMTTGTVTSVRWAVALSQENLVTFSDPFSLQTSFVAPQVDADVTLNITLSAQAEVFGYPPATALDLVDITVRNTN